MTYSCPIFGTHVTAILTEDTCGIEENCEFQDYLQPVPLNDGFLRHIPCVFRCLLWSVYKLVFSRIYPVDRLSRLWEGNPYPVPEPVFKLLTTPSFQGSAMNMLSKLFKSLRYQMLPNSLIVPLTSLTQHTTCPHIYYYYTFNTVLGSLVYGMLCADLVLTLVEWLSLKVQTNSNVLGTHSYRFYNYYWLVSSFPLPVLFLIDVASTFNLSFLQHMWAAWEGLLTFNFGFRHPNDLVKLSTGIVALLSYVSFAVTSASIVQFFFAKYSRAAVEAHAAE